MASNLGLNPPSKIKISTDSNNETAWTCFKEDFNFFMLAAGFKEKSDKEKIALLINIGGPDLKDIYDGITWAAATPDVPDESKVYAKVVSKLGSHFNVKKN